jgi:hypothetical protein
MALEIGFEEDVINFANGKELKASSCSGGERRGISFQSLK